MKIQCPRPRRKDIGRTHCGHNGLIQKKRERNC
jgi:hypothetical protein